MTANGIYAMDWFNIASIVENQQHKGKLSDAELMQKHCMNNAVRCRAVQMSAKEMQRGSGVMVSHQLVVQDFNRVLQLIEILSPADVKSADDEVNRHLFNIGHMQNTITASAMRGTLVILGF